MPSGAPSVPARRAARRGRRCRRRIDLAVVRELQTDGRLAYETLAQRVGLSRPA
ncbi:AsnC family protein, partial [Streptomyces zhihengii]